MRYVQQISESVRGAPVPAARGVSVLEALREATRSRHAQITSSEAMRRLFDAGYTIPEYRAHLGRLLGLFEPLEQAAKRAAGPSNAVYALERSCALREDLRQMGASAREVAALERCRELPAIERAGVDGYTYVILGSMLGGKIIVERLRAVLGAGASFRFYGGNGLPERLWTAFRRHLEQGEEQNVAAVCATAAGIFDAYAAWLGAPVQQAERG